MEPTTPALLDRIALEATRGRADMQQRPAAAQVSVDINTAEASAAVATAEGERQVLEKAGTGEAARIRAVGEANGAAERAIGIGKAAGYAAQREAIGSAQTALVAALGEIGKGGTQIVPQTLITGGGGAGALEGPLQLVLSQVATAAGGDGGARRDVVPVGPACRLGGAPAGARAGAADAVVPARRLRRPRPRRGASPRSRRARGAARRL